MRLWLIALCAALAASFAHAVDPDEQLPDPAMEERARDISQGMRCVVCRNQSIDESDADIAKDMRKLVRQRILEGDSDEEIRTLMVSFYGEQVLLMPRLNAMNAAIWLAPILIFILAGFWYLRRTGRANRRPSPAAAPSAPLSEDERRRLTELLKD